MFVSYSEAPRMDLIGNQAGDTVDTLRGVHWDAGLLRPYLDEQNRPAVTVNTGRVRARKRQDGSVVMNEATGMPMMDPVYEKQLISHRIAQGLPVPNMALNATLLRKDQWILLDNVILTAARARMRAWADLRAANTYGGFDAMANPILEWERVTDVGEAVVDMDGMTEARNFNPRFDLQGMPLPITHADFFLSSRFLAVSRNKGVPADTQRAQLAGWKVGEMIEKTTIGTETGITYGDATGYGGTATSTVYGYLNHPDRLTKTTMHAPTGSNGVTVYNDFLACREQLYASKFYGPFMVYVSDDWDQYLDALFSTTEPSAGTLRKKLLEIDGIQGIRRLDYLTSSTNPFTVLFVEMTPENARAVNGMDITTVQWESMGGMRLNFKVMAIQVPQIRSKYIGEGSGTTACGVLQATTS